MSNKQKRQNKTLKLSNKTTILRSLRNNLFRCTTHTTLLAPILFKIIIDCAIYLLNLRLNIKCQRNFKLNFE